MHFKYTGNIKAIAKNLIGGSFMRTRIDSKKNWSLTIISIALVFTVNCGGSEEKKKTTQSPAIDTNRVQRALPAVSVPPPSAVKKDNGDIAASVDEQILKKSVLEKNLSDRFNTFKDKIPADKIKEVRSNMKKQLVDEFVMRALMEREVEKRNIEATDKEMEDALDQIRTNLPADKKIDEFMKENGISREDIYLGIKVRKMVRQNLGKKAKPSENEISKFYDNNKDRFNIAESVHVRHILVAFKEGDDETIKTEKKLKIESLRKQIADGADFAEVASKNSDCPSKDKGGDLGLIQKGQTVKPFEDAAFSQEKNVVGPVITTDSGYHVIQVLEHNRQKMTPLEDVREKIKSYLGQQKETEAFNSIIKKLRENAKIVIYKN
jgi:peptidyl-prolyl cis-trans isomerase C